MSSLKIKQFKPWAKLRVSRRQYETAKPWKQLNLKRQDYESIIEALPMEVLDGLKLESDADQLIKAMFGTNGF